MNVISDCVYVSVCVCQGVDSTWISNTKSGAGLSLSKAFFHIHTHGNTQTEYITIQLLTFLRPNEVINHLLLFVISGLPRQTALCVSLMMIMLSFCLFLSLLLPPLPNLCVVVGAGADRPRDDI